MVERVLIVYDGRLLELSGTNGSNACVLRNEGKCKGCASDLSVFRYYCIKIRNILGLKMWHWREVPV